MAKKKTDTKETAAQTPEQDTPEVKDESAEKTTAKKSAAKKSSSTKKNAGGKNESAAKGKKKSTRRPRKKKDRKESTHPLAQFGPVRRKFILDHLRTIDYEDMAVLLGIDPGELKNAIETMGIKVPIERARKWGDVDTGAYRALENCARCQVQMNHGSFVVGVEDCRKCYEENIRLWIDKDTEIIIRFPHE